MKTIMQTTWALISLGVILNCIYAQDPDSTSPIDTSTNSTTNATTNVPDTSAAGSVVPTQKDNTSATYSTLPTNVPPTIPMENTTPTVTPVPKTTDAVATNAGSASTGAPHDTKSSSRATTTLDDHSKEQTTMEAPPSGLTTIKPSVSLPNPVSTQATTPGPHVAVTSEALPVETTYPTSTGSKALSTDILNTSSAASRPDLSTGTPVSGATVPWVTTVSIPEDIGHGTTTTPTTPFITSMTSTAPTTQTTVLLIDNNKFKRFSLSKGKEKDEDRKDLTAVCQRLMLDMKNASCTIIWQMDTDVPKFTSVEVVGEVDISTAHRYLEEATKKLGDNTTLIAILASCGALLAMIVGLAIYASHYRKPYNETQQHLTEELQTVENGYHDNPTLEVMEVQPEMQEKKVALNGEFNDSWIVPIDNLLKEDLPEEEDTHL